MEVDTLGGCGQAPERTPWSKLSLQPKRRDWGGRAQVGPSAPTARSKQGGLLRREGGRARPKAERRRPKADFKRDFRLGAFRRLAQSHARRPEANIVKVRPRTT